MIENIHQRIYPGAEAADVSALIDTLGQPEDRLWPRDDRWAPMVLDGPLADLPAGGHGLVRYRTEEFEPGRRVVWRFADEVRLRGTHHIELIDDARGPGLRHTISATPVGFMRVLWPLIVRSLHDQCLEDLLDRAAEQLGTGCDPAEPSRWVRFLLRVMPSPAQELEMLERRIRAKPVEDLAV